ncbi:hypothetical protein LTR78_001612 [Recurvomyces mirabilis]|uniref:Uncharacterized protein n=1 Tax=Recurvomyces mirabilis TaxID=574656 RepID=A0AAE1C502_9PEZI|nr:hypothetical protein LTR78_001612 [Recurvomyces mirabilis]KAK5151816.1 hypothetical protein LTS14_008950 [Recurvomyces mirabilis]
MRMKDSDDYITARAANPWTGLISPSCGSPSPQPRTPETPGEALKLHGNLPPTPTPATKLRPALSRANEGRKVSAGTLHRWRANANGWVSDFGGTVASPRGCDTVAKADLSRTAPRKDLADDSFVVNMPSAREPQPFAHPGCTASQIAALENHRQDELMDGRAFGNITAASFAPFASPKMPLYRGRHTDEDRILRTVHVSEAFRSVSPPAHVAPTPLRKPVHPRMLLQRADARDSSPTMVNKLKQHDYAVFGADQAGNSARRDPRQLPPMRFVHPSMVAIPRHRTQPPQRPGKRVCSLGCEREGNTKMCSERLHKPNATSRSVSATLLFDVHNHASPSNDASGKYDNILTDCLRTIVLGVIGISKHIHPPDMKALSALCLRSATPQQKFDGLKAMLLMVSQVSAFLLAFAVAWRLSMLVTQLVVVVLWPLIILVKVAKWLASG